MFKKFYLLTLCVFLSCCIAIGGFVFAVDPFNVYRANSDLQKIIYQNLYYQNTGIAKHAKYDTLITGTSMTQNFRARWFNDKFGCNAVRLSFDGGIPQNFDALLSCAFKSGNSIKTVYFGLDNTLIISGDDDTQTVPENIFDNNPFNDIKYLLNKDVLFDYIPTYFLLKYHSESYDFYEAFTWDNANLVFSEKKVLDEYLRPGHRNPRPTDYYFDESDYLLDILTKYVREHPETTFVFFSPPYSALYWNSRRISGKLYADVAAVKHTYGELLKYKNVRAFYFQNDFERIENLNNYVDTTHYCADYNRYMLDCFVSGEREMTLSDYEATIDQMVPYAESLNY